MKREKLSNLLYKCQVNWTGFDKEAGEAILAHDAEQREEIERLEKERDAIQETLTFVEGEVAEVYCHITNNQMSKCNYFASDVIAHADEWAWSQIEDYLSGGDFEALDILEYLICGEVDNARESAEMMEVMDSKVTKEYARSFTKLANDITRLRAVESAAKDVIEEVEKNRDIRARICDTSLFYYIHQLEHLVDDKSALEADNGKG